MTQKWREIRPASGWKFSDLKEIAEYRDLIYIFVWRDIKVRYKQSVLGGLWAIIPPFLTMIVFTLFFGKFVQTPSDGKPYPLFYFAALVPWTYFSGALNMTSMSLVGHSQMLRKIYFPRIILPLSAVIGRLLDFVIALGFLLLMMAAYLWVPSIYILTLPLLTAMLVLTAFGGGMLIGALNVRYRDFQWAVSFLLQFVLYASPVIYPVSVVPERFRWLYALNPLVGIIEGFRAALLGSEAFPWLLLAIGFVSSVVLFFAGLFYFKSVEQVFADIA